MSRRRVVVVGGGVTGCAVAFALAGAGHEVTLLERDAIGAHASRWNAGNLNPLHGTPPALVAPALEAFRRHGEIIRALTRLGCTGHETAPVTRVHLGLDAQDAAKLQETLALFNAHDGFSARWVDWPELRALQPRLSPEFGFAVVTQGALSIDGAGFTRALAAGAERLGARVQNAAVNGVVTTGGSVSAVRTAEGELPCDELVLATGPWTAETQAWLGVDPGIVPVKGELLLLELEDRPITQDFTWRAAALYRRREAEVWVGGTMAECGLDAAPSEAGAAALLAGAARIMPSLAASRRLGYGAALRPVAAAGMPLAARAPGWRNVYFANGGGQKGLLFSALIAARLRDLLAGAAV